MIKNFLDSDQAPEESEPAPFSGSILSAVPPAENTVVDPDTGTEEPYIFPSVTARPESIAETVRKSGLAWSAGIALFASVVFMLVIGWGVDLLLGTSPWGIVGGIVLGSVIGFVQFYRITSRIFDPNRDMNEGRMLITKDDEPK